MSNLHENLPAIVIFLLTLTLIILYSYSLITLLLYRLYYIRENTSKLNNIKSVNLFSPHHLILRIDEIFAEEGELFIFKPTFHKCEKYEDVLINLIFYFNLLQLPCFPMTLITNNEFLLKEIVNDMDEFCSLGHDGKLQSLHKLSTIRRLDTIHSFMTKKQTLNKADTLMSKFIIIIS